MIRDIYRAIAKERYSEPIKKALQDRWPFGGFLSEDEAIKIVLEIGIVCHPDLVREIYKEVAEKNDITRVQPVDFSQEEGGIPDPPPLGDALGEKLGELSDDLSDLRYIEYKCGGTKILIDLLGEA